MILFELCRETEGHPVYQQMATSNGARHYHFLESAVKAALDVDRPFLSQTVIKAINYHAIACLHPYAGEYRPCKVTVGNHTPPMHFRVQSLMDDLVNWVNRYWDNTDPVTLAAFVLWRLNHIHPFINGNGRTARAACYFVLCLKLKRWLPGTKTVPELLKDPQTREKYIDALVQADRLFKIQDAGYLNPVVQILEEVLIRQFQNMPTPTNARPPDSAG